MVSVGQCTVTVCTAHASKGRNGQCSSLLHRFARQFGAIVEQRWLAAVSSLLSTSYHSLTPFRTLSKLSIGLLGVTTALFLYLLIWLPYIRNSLPNYQHWNVEADTKSVIPVSDGIRFGISDEHIDDDALQILTLSILSGWSSLFIAFASTHSLLFSFFISGCNKRAKSRLKTHDISTQPAQYTCLYSVRLASSPPKEDSRTKKCDFSTCFSV